MNIVIGNIFDYTNELDFIGITTNSTLNSQRHLVMGAGNAKQAKLLCPELPQAFGKLVLEKNASLKYYGILKYKKYFAFQTKLHWKDKSPMWVVKKSVEDLFNIALKYPDHQFGIPFPAINHGGLKEEDVLPYLQKLPDNVTIYKLPSK